MFQVPGGSNFIATGLLGPYPPAALVGRDPELAALGDLLQEHRLVTLSGPPGIGKTRLAIEHAAAEQHAGRPVAFLRLSTVLDPVQFEQRISQTCTIDAWTDLPVSKLPEWANGLLILDGLDYVPDAGTTIVTLLNRCPRLRVIVAARTMLGLGEERVLTLEPLAGHSEPGSPAPATALFLQKSGLDSIDESHVAAMSGNPLALGLLAARARIDGLDPFDSAAVAGSPLSDVVHWVIASIPDELRSMLRRLSALAGGFTLDAARAVSRLPEASLVEGALEQLVDRGLIDVVSGSSPRASWEMPSVIREVALKQLLQAGELAGVRMPHARYLLERAETMRDALAGQRRAVVLAEFELEQPAIRLAFATVLEGRRDYLARRLAVAVWPCLLLTRHYREARRYLNAAIELADPTQPDELQQELLAASGLVELLAGHTNAARGRASAAAQPGSREPDTFWRGVSLATLGLVAARNGEPDLAIGHYRIFLQASSAKKSAKGWASTLKAMFEIALSTAHFAQGEIEDAEYQANLAYTQSLRESDALLAGYARINLAAIATAKRAWLEALEMYRDGLPLLLERPHGGAVACGLAGLANLAIQLEAFSTAGELLSLSRLLAAAGTPAPPNLICFDVDLLSARLPATGISAASPSSVIRWSELQPLIEEAVDDLLNTLRPEPVSKERRAPDALTRRELEALCLATEGMTNREIADALFIGTRTAEDHMQKVMSKLGVNNRAGAIARALREGWCT